MKAAWTRYYDRPSLRAPFAFTFAALRARSPAKKLALLNRARDYRRVADDPALLALHRDLHAILLEQQAGWSAYDYGEDWFYQGLREVGVTGLRDTEARVAAYRLEERVRGRRVLEIGCNTGFLTLAVAPAAASIDAHDVNPFLVRVAQRARAHLGRPARFTATAFEDLAPAGAYDTVISFANHSTFDGQTRQPVAEYFERCAGHLAPGGELLFESHAPAYEGEDALEEVLRVLAERFEIRERMVLGAGTYLDRGRTFVAATKR